MEKWRRMLFLGIVLIALGVIFTTTLSSKFGSLGIVFIALGGLFFIIGMNKKNKEEKDTGEKEKHE
ncbi:hypothetical protein [Thermotomaculum hydrothermale]|uniref:hypothetical protein n=1 Tax=Thermotomaculum hydrothermale TaxID=981385 RepID=UPI001916199E|nr:hypothetical protein [Thermotomaculum hydrothermale]